MEKFKSNVKRHNINDYPAANLTKSNSYENLLLTVEWNSEE